MKRGLALLLCFCLPLGLAACEKGQTDAPEEITVAVQDGELTPTSQTEAPVSEKTSPDNDVCHRYEPPHFVRVHPPQYDGSQGVLAVVKSKEALAAFYQTNREALDLGAGTPDAANPYYQFDPEETGATDATSSTAGFADWMPHYDDAFFADNVLLIVKTTESSGSNRYTNAQFADGTVYLTVEIPEVGTCDMADWLTLLCVQKDLFGAREPAAIAVEKTTVKAAS